jgi:pyroglutamyl-peptidase
MILATAFDPFGGDTRNPSQAALETLMQTGKYPWIISEILPTKFAIAGKRIRDLISTHRPTACLCFGVNQNAKSILLEQQAVNLNACNIPDNAGEIRNSPILPTGPASYHGTLPYTELLSQLQKHNIPCQLSNNAGTFVCNHVFYIAADEIHKLNLPTRVGFIHVAWPSDWDSQNPSPSEISLASITDAMQICFRICHELLST